MKSQITGDGQLPPGMDLVLRALSPEASVLVVHHFLTHPHVDLVLNGERTSPRDWLTAGQDPMVAAALAASALDVP